MCWDGKFFFPLRTTLLVRKGDTNTPRAPPAAGADPHAARRPAGGARAVGRRRPSPALGPATAGAALGGPGDDQPVARLPAARCVPPPRPGSKRRGVALVLGPGLPIGASIGKRTRALSALFSSGSEAAVKIGWNFFSLEGPLRIAQRSASGRSRRRTIPNAFFFNVLCVTGTHHPIFDAHPSTKPCLTHCPEIWLS